MNWNGKYFVTLELPGGTRRRVDASRPLPKGGCTVIAVDNGLTFDKQSQCAPAADQPVDPLANDNEAEALRASIRECLTVLGEWCDGQPDPAILRATLERLRDV